MPLVVAINRIVDPFWYFQDIEIEGFNKVKTKVQEFERYVKPKILQRRKVDAIILGSSYSEIGLNPQNIDFSKQGEFNGYNFAFAGGGWDRTFCYFKYAIQHAPIKRIVLGMHPQNPHPIVDCSQVLPEIQGFSQLKLLFSLEALKASISTVRKQGDRESSHTRDGLFFYDRGKSGAEKRFHEVFKTELYSNKRCNLKALEGRVKVQQLEYSLARENRGWDISGLQYLMQLAIKQQIDLNIFAYPQHALSMELGVLCKNYQNIWLGLAAMAFLPETQSEQVKLWSFYSYNTFTAESIVDNEPVFWQDPKHFNFEFGDKMLGVMFNSKPQSIVFGYRLHENNINSMYADFKRQRKKYLLQNPTLLGELKQFVEQ